MRKKKRKKATTSVGRKRCRQQMTIAKWKKICIGILILTTINCVGVNSGAPLKIQDNHRCGRLICDEIEKIVREFGRCGMLRRLMHFDPVNMGTNESREGKPWLDD